MIIIEKYCYYSDFDDMITVVSPAAANGTEASVETLPLKPCIRITTELPPECYTMLLLTQRVQIPLWYVHRPESHDIVPPLRPKYMPYTYMNPVGHKLLFQSLLVFHPKPTPPSCSIHGRGCIRRSEPGLQSMEAHET